MTELMFTCCGHALARVAETGPGLPQHRGAGQRPLQRGHGGQRHGGGGERGRHGHRHADRQRGGEARVAAQGRQEAGHGRQGRAGRGQVQRRPGAGEGRGRGVPRPHHLPAQLLLQLLQLDALGHGDLLVDAAVLVEDDVSGGQRLCARLPAHGVQVAVVRADVVQLRHALRRLHRLGLDVDAAHFWSEAVLGRGLAQEVILPHHLEGPEAAAGGWEALDLDGRPHQLGAVQIWGKIVVNVGYFK